MRVLYGSGATSRAILRVRSGAWWKLGQWCLADHGAPGRLGLDLLAFQEVLTLAVFELGGFLRRGRRYLGQSKWARTTSQALATSNGSRSRCVRPGLLSPSRFTTPERPSEGQQQGRAVGGGGRRGAARPGPPPGIPRFPGWFHRPPSRLVRHPARGQGGVFGPGTRRGAGGLSAAAGRSSGAWGARPRGLPRRSPCEWVGAVRAWAGGGRQATGGPGRLELASPPTE